MSILSLIAAVDEHGGIGKNNQLLCHLPADLKHFKEITLHKPIIMGHKTFQSIGRALPQRLNIVLSRAAGLQLEGATVVDSLFQAITLTLQEPEVVVIGGGGVFEQALPLASKIYLTLIHAKLDADVFFPKIDMSQWRLSSKVDRPQDEKNPFALTFLDYLRKEV